MAVKDPLDFESIFEEKEESKNEKLELLNSLVKENYSTDNIAVKTDLNENEIRVFSVGLLFGERYKNPLVTDLVNKLMTLKLSKNRKSRKESVEISKSLLGSNNPEEVEDNSFRKKLLGK